MNRRGFLALLGTGGAGGAAVVGSQRAQFAHGDDDPATAHDSAGNSSGGAVGVDDPAAASKLKTEVEELRAETQRLKAERDRLQSDLQTQREQREQELIGLYESAASPQSTADEQRAAVTDAADGDDWQLAVKEAEDGAVAARKAVAHLDELNRRLGTLHEQGRVDDRSPATVTRSLVFVGNLALWHETYHDYCVGGTRSDLGQPYDGIADHPGYEDVWQSVQEQLDKNSWTSVEQFKDEIEFSW